ncbi:MAG: hypothetical protein AAGA26_00840 [Pseudomonadota bacterium]
MTTAVGTRGRSAMALIATCFLASALIRLVDPASAFAVEVTNLANQTYATKADESVTSDTVVVEEDLRTLLALLKEREEQLDRETIRLEERQRTIEASEAKLRAKINQLEEAERRLAETLRIADRAADDDIDRLVSAFEAMDSKKAAPIVENMDVAFASGLISRMKGKAAADILGGLTAEKAYAISVYMVGQNARAPTE